MRWNEAYVTCSAGRAKNRHQGSRSMKPHPMDGGDIHASIASSAVGSHILLHVRPVPAAIACAPIAYYMAIAVPIAESVIVVVVRVPQVDQVGERRVHAAHEIKPAVFTGVNANLMDSGGRNQKSEECL